MHLSQSFGKITRDSCVHIFFISVLHAYRRLKKRKAGGGGGEKKRTTHFYAVLVERSIRV